MGGVQVSEGEDVAQPRGKRGEAGGGAHGPEREQKHEAASGSYALPHSCCKTLSEAGRAKTAGNLHLTARSRQRAAFECTTGMCISESCAWGVPGACRDSQEGQAWEYLERVQDRRSEVHI